MKKSALFYTLILGVVHFCSPSCEAQNLLRNGDHEIFIPKPSVPNPSDLCFRELYPFGLTPPPLNPLNPLGIASANGSADHRCNVPFSGQAHGGFFMSPKMENPFYALCFPTTPGEGYELSLHWRLSTESGQTAQTMFFWLTDTTYQPTGNNVFSDETGLLTYSEPGSVSGLDAIEYQEINLPFTAESAVNGLIVGNMTTATLPNGSEIINLQSGSGFAYYYIDDLRVRPIPRIIPVEPVCPKTPVVLRLANNQDCNGSFGMDWYALSSDTTFIGTGDTILWEGEKTTTILAMNAFDTIQTVVEITSMAIETDTFFAIPNVFTPNQDGTNDEFRPLLRTQVKQFSMSIHSRWGKELFKTHDPKTGWDGRFQNEDSPSDVYAFRIEMVFEACGQEVTIVKRGEVSLIR